MLKISRKKNSQKIVEKTQMGYLMSRDVVSVLSKGFNFLKPKKGTYQLFAAE